MGKIEFKKGQKIELGNQEAKGAQIMIGLSCGDCSCKMVVKDIDVEAGIMKIQPKSTSSCSGACIFSEANHTDI